MALHLGKSQPDRESLSVQLQGQWQGQNEGTVMQLVLLTTFLTITAGSALADPSVVVIDQLTGQVVFEKSAYSQRKPASVLKIYSAAAGSKRSYKN